jgi:GDSL-like Lipase/Acylhydrolase family
MGKRLLAIGLGSCAGGVLAIGAWMLWTAIRPAARPIDAAHKAELRQLLDANPSAIFMFDEATSFRYKPRFHGYRLQPAHLGSRNAVRFAHVTNSLGLIGADEPDAQRPKILLLGDSVTYGVWVDERDAFPARMQQLAGTRCQLLAGVCEGWSTKQEIAFYETYLRALDWRAIAIVFCLNDLVDFEWTYRDGVRPQLSEEILSVGNGGTRTNQTLGGLKLAALKAKFAADPKTAPLARQTNTSLWAWEDDRWDRYLRQTLGPFVERTAGQRKLAVVMSPTQGQLKALAAGGSATTVLHPQFRMTAFCEERHVTCIDLADAFNAASADELDAYFLDDLHFSEEGHKAVAAFLWPRLKALL